MPAVRVIIDDAPGDGAWNMAVDEALLESGVHGDGVTLRWYAWRVPTISLGYFQSVPEFAPDDPLYGLPLVRRLSGGGAILHHHEWTYSCVLPASHPFAARPTLLYTEVHEAMIDVLASLGANARLRGERTAADEKHIFLCFLRGDPRDVVLADHKIIGSAQRRRGGAVLQHGSLLLRSSRHAPEQPGLHDLAIVHLDDTALRDQLAASVARRLSDVGGDDTFQELVQRSAITTPELEAARLLLRERYTNLDWKAK
jgi:lipoate-protein ligase A